MIGLKNPLHRYIVDYQVFNPLQTLISTRYKPATGRRRTSYLTRQPAVMAAQKPKFRPKSRHFYSTENSGEPFHCGLQMGYSGLHVARLEPRPALLSFG
jgi:hypothetical protein